MASIAPPPAPSLSASAQSAGEPLSVAHHAQAAVQLLQQALNTDNLQARAAAESQIKQLEARDGWRMLMMHIGMSVGCSEDVRTLALILLKHRLESLFRPRWAAIVHEKDGLEKNEIKRALMHVHRRVGFDAAQMSETVGKMVSACVAICARSDWPKGWDGGEDALFPTLLTALQSNHTPLILRALATLHEVLKSLQASRLLISIRKFQQATASIITLIRTNFINIQSECTNMLGSALQNKAFTQDVVSSLVERCKLSHLYLKCLRRLVTYGINDVSNSPDTQALFPFFLQQLGALVQILPQIAPRPDAHSSNSPPFLPSISAITLLFMRIVNETLKRHHMPFRAFFQPFIQFSVQLLQHHATQLVQYSPINPNAKQGSSELMLFPSSTVLEPLCIECILYLQNVLTHYTQFSSLFIHGQALSSESSSNGVGGNSKEAAAAAAEASMAQVGEMMKSIFTPSFIQQLVTLLLSHYLVLKGSDMEQWNNDPESFYNEERVGSHSGDDGSGDDQTLVVMSAGNGGGADGAHEHKLRLVADNLIRLLLEKLPDAVAPQLLTFLMQVLQQSPPGSGYVAPSGNVTPGQQPNLILLKESIYTALGDGFLQIPALLQSQLQTNFTTFFNEILAKELGGSGDGGGTQTDAGKIIRRRTIWLLGEWVESVGDDVRMHIYAAIVKLLNDPDLVVRMTAIDTLFRIIDNHPFQVDETDGGGEDDILDLTASTQPLSYTPAFEQFLAQLATHLAEIFTLLFNILQNEMELMESKHHILIIVSRFISTLQSRLLSAPGALDVLLRFLPTVWNDCINRQQNLLRTAILDVITKLIESLGYRSSLIHSQVVLHMLSYVFDAKRVANETSYLVEQALDMWKATLRHAATYSAELGSLFPLLVSYMATHTGYLQVCMEIIESYIHLGKADFMQQYAGSVAEVFAGLLRSSQQSRLESPPPHSSSSLASSFKRGSVALSTGVEGEGVVTEKAVVLIMSVLEAISQIYPKEVPQLFHQTFHFMLRGIIDSATTVEMSEEAAAKSNIHVPSDPVLASYFVVLGRVFFQNCEGGVSMLSAMSGPNPHSQFPLSIDQLLCSLLDVWCRKLDSISNVYKKKVCVLAMVRLLATNHPAILNKMRTIMACVRRVERELSLPGAQLEQADWSAALKTPPQQRIEQHRIQMMLYEDPSNNVSVRQSFLDQLNQLNQRIGQAALQQIISTCDPLVWQQIQQG